MHTQDIALLSAQDAVQVYQLVEKLCEEGADPQAWRKHFATELCRIFDAEVSFSYLRRFTIDPSAIGPDMLVLVDHGGSDIWKQYVARGDVRSNPITAQVAERFGTDFTVTRQEWVDDNTWYGSNYFKNIAKPSNWDHLMVSHVGIIRPGVVDGIGIGRRIGSPPFSMREVAKLRLLHQELARLWRKHDPLDIHMLPRRQRQVLDGIRRGESRKAIAKQMKVTDHTVHAYEKKLFNRAGVTSRTQLLAITSKLIRPTLIP